MAEIPPYDPDEKVSLYPLTGEEVLGELLGEDEESEGDAES